MTPPAQRTGGRPACPLPCILSEQARMDTPWGLYELRCDNLALDAWVWSTHHVDSVDRTTELVSGWALCRREGMAAAIAWTLARKAELERGAAA